MIMIKVGFPFGCYQNYVLSNSVLLPICEFGNCQTPIIAPIQLFVAASKSIIAIREIVLYLL